MCGHCTPMLIEDLFRALGVVHRVKFHSYNPDIDDGSFSVMSTTKLPFNPTALRSPAGWRS